MAEAAIEASRDGHNQYPRDWALLSFSGPLPPKVNA